MRRRLLTPLVLLLLAVAGCGDGGSGEDAADLRRQLDAQDRIQTALRERIEELENRVEAFLVADDDPDSDPLADLDERLASVEDTLESLSTRIDQEVAGRIDLEARVDEAEGTLTGHSSTLTELRDELQLLREDIEALRRRFENHEH